MERDEFMVHRTTTPNCNPQEDSHHGKKISPEPAPWPNKGDRDLPPWSQLEQMKKEANEVAMHSFPLDEQSQQRKAIITVISGGRAVCESGTLAKDQKRHSDAADDRPLDDIVDDQGFPKEPLTLYTSFAKEVGYVYPFEGGFGTTSSTSSMRHNTNSNNGEEHTVENFNQFLEISSMTINSVDHALAMGKKDPRPRPVKAPEMVDAPSGILMVFDRLLDCIDPKEKRLFLHEDEEESFGFETDQSSTSWLETQLRFDELSIVTDEGSLFRFDVQSDWLDDSLDCIFPCWKDPQVCDEILQKQPSQKELAKAVSRKRAAKEQTKEEKGVAHEEKRCEAKAPSELKDNDDDPFDVPPPEFPLQASEAKPSSEPNENNDDDPFDFPPPEFPPPVWKKPIEIDSNTLESDGSSLPEVFQGLPSDEKEERVRELHTYLDRTSATEDTSTLSYSDGTL